MWLKLFQGLVVFLVIASNIRWKWTPNGYLAAMLAGVTAACMTWLLLRTAELCRRLKPRRDQRGIGEQQLTQPRQHVGAIGGDLRRLRRPQG